MLNLIRKEIVLQKKTLMIMLPLLFVFLFEGISSIWIGVIFCIPLIMQSFSIEERSSIQLLLNSLPYTRKEIVSSKYLGAFVFTFFILTTISIGNLIIYGEITQWKQLLFIFCSVALFISFAFPFSYQFKSQYIMTAFAILFVLYLIVINKFISNLNDRLREGVRIVLSYDNTLLYAGVLLTVVVLSFFSWMLSIRIYSRKVL
ncbi:ABC-2 transporter permease [Ureibacillus sinduriensis]|uniref:ABC transporter permease n=1 Tax=Ureibacillus sinduriensis BLB-1 = JCM 15800 TaxID=1384057 RepID=A0A0A3HUR6_9BACL|nr:ABC-2 transporter permease [Ureibacillus sinduriensis]KGR76306.1 ABC transporter permease [Ureibacillus sinduriensis BLB-1 = JCM 15800]